MNFSSQYLTPFFEISLYELSDEERSVVNKTLKCFGFNCDFVGLDYFVTDEALIFNEAEDVAGTRMLYALTDMDAAKIYLGYIYNRI